jgi:hypothetical protein
LSALPAISLGSFRGNFNQLGQFSMLKFFPLGFLLTDQPEYEGLASLTSRRNLNGGTSETVTIDFSAIRGPYWPEQTDPGNFVFGGEDAAQSVESKPKTKYH